MAQGQPHPTALGTLLRTYRQMAGLTQEMLAAEAGYSSVYIGMLERGRRTPRVATVEMLAVALELAPAERAALVEAAQRAAYPPEDDPAPAASHTHAQTPRLPDADRPVLLVTGAAGTGKTRMLLDLAAQARTTGWAVLEGTCREDDAARSSPFAPITQALGSCLASSPSERMSTILADYSWLMCLLPGLAESSRCRSSHPLALTRERRLVFSALGSLLAELAGPEGTLLAFDDLQWAGDAALDLLALLLRAEGGRPLRLIATYRADAELASSALAGWLADLASAQLATYRRLGGWLPAMAEMPDELERDPLSARSSVPDQAQPTGVARDSHARATPAGSA